MLNQNLLLYQKQISLDIIKKFKNMYMNLHDLSFSQKMKKLSMEKFLFMMNELSLYVIKISNNVKNIHLNIMKNCLKNYINIAFSFSKFVLVLFVII